MGDVIVDFENILYSAAKFNYETSREDKPSLPAPEDVSFGRINYDTVHMKREELQWDAGPYNVQAAAMAGAPTKQVLFTSTFVNNSTAPQKHTLRTKATAAEVKVTLTKGAYFGASSAFGVQLPLEDRYEDAAAVFGASLTLQGEAAQKISTETSWSTEEKITVPDDSAIKAEVAITERHHATTFTMKTRFKGTVSLVVTDPRRNNSTLIFMPVDIYEAALRAAKDNSLPRDVVKLDEHKRSVVITTEGRLNMRYGIDKKVIITNVPHQKPNESS